MKTTKNTTVQKQQKRASPPSTKVKPAVTVSKRDGLTREGFIQAMNTTIFTELERARLGSLEEAVPRPALLLNLAYAAGVTQYALNRCVEGILAGEKWTTREEMEQLEMRLDQTGFEVWPFGPLTPPILFKQVLDEKDKPTGQYFLGPNVGDGLLVKHGKADVPQDYLTRNGIVTTAFYELLKTYDPKTAAKINTRLKTGERLNPFIRFVRQSLVSETPFCMVCVYRFGWEVRRGWDNHHYAIYELGSIVSGEVIPFCLLLNDKQGRAVLLKCNYEELSDLHRAALIKPGASRKVFDCKWIRTLFRQKEDTKSYKRLLELSNVQEKAHGVD